MIWMHESPRDLADQDASVVPGGAAYLQDSERRRGGAPIERDGRPHSNEIRPRKIRTHDLR